MTDYTQLIKELRGCAEHTMCPLDCSRDVDGPCIENLMNEAADAIAELTDCLEGVTAENGELAGRLLESLAKGCELLQKMQQLPKWISVDERLPNEGQIVIAKGKRDKTWDFGMYRAYTRFDGTKDPHKWNWKKNTVKDVDWWMPKDRALPDPPEVDT